MTIDERLRDALSSIDPDATPTPAAWASITRRTTRQARIAQWTRRAGIALVPVVALAAVTFGVLRYGDSPQQVSTAGTPAPTPSTSSSSGGPATTTTTSPEPAAAGIPLDTVDWSRAAALDCGSTSQGPVATTVIQVAYPTPTPGKTVAVVLVRCDAGAGTPPTALFVFDRATSPTSAHPLQTLMDGRPAGPQAAHPPVGSNLTANGKTLTVHEDSYSTAAVPACCPDRHDDLTWQWTDGSYALDLRAEPVSGTGR